MRLRREQRPIRKISFYSERDHFTYDTIGIERGISLSGAQGKDRVAKQPGTGDLEKSRVFTVKQCVFPQNCPIPGVSARNPRSFASLHCEKFRIFGHLSQLARWLLFPKPFNPILPSPSPVSLGQATHECDHRPCCPNVITPSDGDLPLPPFGRIAVAAGRTGRQRGNPSMVVSRAGSFVGAPSTGIGGQSGFFARG